MVFKEDQAGAIGELLEYATGIAIFPELTKLGIGIQFGEGIVVLRKDQKTHISRFCSMVLPLSISICKIGINLTAFH